MTLPAKFHRRSRAAVVLLAFALCAACGDKDAKQPPQGEEAGASPAATAAQASSAEPAAAPAAATPAPTASVSAESTPSAPAAASAAADAASSPAAPKVVTTEYGDWVVNCQMPAEGPRQCEAVQTLVADKKPVARIAVGRNPDTGAYAIAVNLPPAVGFGLPVTVSGEKAEDSQIALTWRRCAPGGCFADTTPPAKVFAAWSALTGKGRLTFLGFNDDPITMPMSFRGLAEAIKGLDEEP